MRLSNILISMVLLLSLNNCSETKIEYTEPLYPKLPLPKKTDTSILYKESNISIFPYQDKRFVLVPFNDLQFYSKINIDKYNTTMKVIKERNILRDMIEDYHKTYVNKKDIK